MSAGGAGLDGQSVFETRVARKVAVVKSARTCPSAGAQGAKRPKWVSRSGALGWPACWQGVLWSRFDG